MDLETLETADQVPKIVAVDKRNGSAATGVILKVIAAMTIAASFIQVLRGGCTPLTVVQFWLSLFVGATLQRAAGNARSDAVEVCLGRDESCAI